MSVRILEDTREGIACLYDSVSGIAFGPVETRETLERLLETLERDARLYSSNQLLLRAAQLSEESA